jgi:uncharacterized protein (TIGR03032 family)
MPDADPSPLPPLRSVHSTTFAALLCDLNISLLVSTYQAGKLIVIRADASGGVNTHFRAMDRPMGIAVDKNRVAIGTAGKVREYHNVPAVAAKLKGDRPHDAAYLPRVSHSTGNILIHEMAWAGDELWMVNTRFSCLCTRAVNYSFIPKWRPKFISELAAEDRCHLNGLAIRDGRPRYVTALGTTNTAAGWRADKATGGVVIDIDTDEVIAANLSMPHSPRWAQNRLWVLQSGTGGFGQIDPATGQYQNMITLPGFTRGLDFHDRYAFIGLSQVRESAHFSNLPITTLPVEERACGVWVVDLITTKIVALLQFKDAVQEVFAVAVLPETSYPDVVVEPGILADSFIVPENAQFRHPAQKSDRTVTQQAT